jgi:hypothetical protein
VLLNAAYGLIEIVGGFVAGSQALNSPLPKSFSTERV